MRQALIGHTGFIGKNLVNNFNFTDLYNSKNIDDIINQEFDLVLSSGNSSLKWYANLKPEEDLSNIQSFIEKIKTIKTKKFVLLSTIDVYSNPIDVDETDESDSDEKKPYGNHRRILEEFVKNHFEDYLIIRLPIVYGKYFSKNLIFDVLNNNQVDKINPNSEIQIFNVKNLSNHINNFLEQNLKVVNLSTEPLIVGELFENVFSIKLTNTETNFVESDMKSIFTNNGTPYHYDKDYLIKELTDFKKDYETRGI